MEGSEALRTEWWTLRGGEGVGVSPSRLSRALESFKEAWGGARDGQLLPVDLDFERIWQKIIDEAGLQEC